MRDVAFGCTQSRPSAMQLAAFIRTFLGRFMIIEFDLIRLLGDAGALFNHPMPPQVDCQARVRWWLGSVVSVQPDAVLSSSRLVHGVHGRR